MPNLCSGGCGRPAHPAYGSRCEDCWVGGQPVGDRGFPAIEGNGYTVTGILTSGSGFRMVRHPTPWSGPAYVFQGDPAWPGPGF